MKIKLPRMLPLPSCIADIRRNGQSQPTHQKAGEGAEAMGEGDREGDRAVEDKATRPTANQSKRGGPAPTHHHNDGGLFCSERPPHPTDRYSQRGKQKNHGLVDDPRIRCTWTSFCVLGTYFGTLHVQYLSIQK